MIKIYDDEKMMIGCGCTHNTFAFGLNVMWNAPCFPFSLNFTVLCFCFFISTKRKGGSCGKKT